MGEEPLDIAEIIRTRQRLLDSCVNLVWAMRLLMPWMEREFRAQGDPYYMLIYQMHVAMIEEAQLAICEVVGDVPVH